MPDPVTTPPNNGTPPGGAANEPWFPKERADYVTNKGWKNPGELLESYTNLETLLGAEKAGRTLVMPKDDKDLEGHKAFRAKLGVPESADKYEIPVPENDSGEFLKVAAGWFHELGIPKAAAQGLAGKWNEYWAGAAKQLDEQMVAESNKQMDALKMEWGGEFDKKSAFARDFLKHSGWSDDKVTQYEKTFGTGAMLKDFYAWGSKVQEPGFAGAANQGSGGGGVTITKDVAKAKYTEIQANRMSGAITDKEWQSTKKAEFEMYAAVLFGT
jgi:hypothetical protein